MSGQAKRRPSAGYAPTKMSDEESRAWQAATAVLDRVANEMERAWGVGRLPTLVPPDLAAKFARAEEQCEIAIASGDVDAAAQKASALARGWRALDQAARAEGHKPADVGAVWCAEAGGRSFAVCLNRADSGAVADQFPDHTVVALPELLALLCATEAGRLVFDAKDTFPGATVAVKPAATKPAPDWSKGDDMPW